MRGLKFLRVATPLAIAAAAAVAGLSVSGGSDASALVRYKVCTVADYGWCNVNEEHSYIDVATGQYNFAGNPGTEYGFWCSRLYNADTNTYHAKKCGYARAVTTCYRGGGIHMRGNGQNGDNWGKQTIIVYARTASDSYSC
jgi:hypothetical protein